MSKELARIRRSKKTKSKIAESSTYEGVCFKVP